MLGRADSREARERYVACAETVSLCLAGDPGSTRFFLSLEDTLFRIFGGDRIRTLMTAFSVEDLPIESEMLTNALSEAQRKGERP